MSEVTTTNKIQQDMAECENSKRILKSTISLLKEAVYQGSKHRQVSESINYLEFLEGMMDATLEDLRKKKVEAKKDAKASAIAEAKAELNVTPSAEVA